MAVFKIFPEKDAFITSQFPTANTGLDEILELASFPDIAGQGQSSRILIKFADENVNKVLDIISGSNYQAIIRVYLAEAFEIPTAYTVVASPLYLGVGQEWVQGVGKFGDVPVNQTGVSWKTFTVSQDWPLILPADVTSSFTNVVGGGTWYSGSLEGHQEHLTASSHDLNIDVTAAMVAMQNQTIENNGFILRLEDALDFNTGLPIRLKYFSRDTNTVYPPILELKWDDSVYSTTLPLLTTDLATIRLSNGKSTYRVNTKQRFNLAVRPKFPERQFSTTSIFSVNYRLPQNSYWAIKDEFTEEMVVDFDEMATKVSADSKSSFFNIYMDGLQPERYYRVLIKTEVNGSQVVMPLEEPFKVVRNA